MKFKSKKAAIILFILLAELIVYSHNNFAISFFKRTNDTYKKFQVPYKKKDNNVESENLFIKKINKKPKLHDSGDDDNSVWSNAFNFNKLLGSEVDPQTGVFSVFFKAGNLLGNLGHGPNIDLKLNYHSNTRVDPDGIGYGWSWNLTHFNLTTNQLTTAYGQRFYLENHGKNNWKPRYHKLKDIKITGDKSSHFVISYANGIKETLSHQGYIIHMEQQDGWSVNFVYKQGTNLLKTIVDDQGNKMGLVRSQGYLFVSSHSSHGQPVIVRISTQDHQVRKLALLSKNNQQILPETYINYSNNNLISSVQYPSGIKKIVNYNCTQAMKFSLHDHFAKICVVTRESINSGNEKYAQTINYEYSASDEDQHNYLGYNSGLSYLPGAEEDILFEAPANYIYHTVKDNGLIREVRTWNKYHLLTKVWLISDQTGHLLSEVENFFCDTNTSNDCAHTSFRDLPATYSLPLKVITRTWGDNTDYAATDIEIKTYDDYGRLTQHTDSYGRTTYIHYCPIAGDESGCPALLPKWSPGAWPKSIAVYPASPSKLPPVITYYSYHKFPDFNGKDYTLVIDHKTIKSKDQQVTLTSHYYQDPFNALTYGQLRQTILTGKEEQDAVKISIVHNFRYIKHLSENSQTVYSSVVLDKDKSQQLPAITTSLFTHQVLQRTDASGQNITCYHYDLLGRLIQTDTAAGTAFAASVHYKYIRTAEENQVIITAANGLQHKIIFDNFGRPVMRFDESISAKEVRQPDQWRLTKKIDYDLYGRIKSKIAYLLDKENKSIPLVTTKEYDESGRILYSHLPDGETAVTLYDNPDRCMVSYSIDRHDMRSPLTAIRNNSLNKPVWKQIFPTSSAFFPDIKKLCNTDNQQKNVKRYFTTYDGFGRIIMTKDPLGHLIKKHYDYMGNVVSITDPDNNTIHLQYNLTGQVTAHWALPASGGKYLLASAGYNAAGQTVWKAGEDGKKTWFTYTPSGQVATAITPAGHTISTKYNVLGLPVAKYVDNKLLQTIGYDHVTTLPIIKNDMTGTTKVTYSIDNLPLQLVHKGKNNYPDYNLSWQYDNNRRVISFFNIADDQTRTTYDNFGRIAALCYRSHTGKEEALSTPVYDDFSRIFSIKYGSGMQRKITYDSWGRKNQITDTLRNKLLTSWNLSYDANDNITTLIKQADNYQQAILNYQYDNLDNLVTMDCRGSAGLPLCPRDTATVGSQINIIPVIIHQHYTFTPLNRLAQVREVLRNSETGKTLDKIVTHEYSDKNAPLRLKKISTQWNNKTVISHKFSYDIAGNMVTDGEGNHITYNPFNQITYVVTPDGQQSNYIYNGNGKEIFDKNSSGTHYLFYSGNQLINEQIDSPEQKTHIIDYQGVAKAIDGVIYQYDESNYKRDVTATLTKISTSSDYQLSERTVYSPYGMRWNSKPAAVSLYQYNLTGFDGERTDFLTGWQFLGEGHRTYNPKLRNFVSEDPAGDGYAFGGNNPVMKTDPDGNMPKWLGDVFKYMGYVTSFGAKTSSARWLKVVGSAAASAFITLASCGTLAVTTVPSMILNGIPYCLSTTSGAAPANKPLNIAASVTGAAQMIAFAAVNVACLGYSAFSAFCATAEIGTVLEATDAEAIEMSSLSRAAISGEDNSLGIFRCGFTNMIERRDGLNWVAIRDNHELTAMWNRINCIYRYNMITRAIGVTLIAAKKTAKQLNLSVMQDLLSAPSGAFFFSIYHERLLNELFTPLSQEAVFLYSAIASENLGTIFLNPGDLFVLLGYRNVSLVKWVNGSFSDNIDDVNLVSYEMHIDGSVKETQDTPYSVLEAFRHREGEFMINRYYRL